MIPEHPRVSVIVPNRDYAATLPLCLRSAMSQSCRPGEVIVVDDGSTDGSVAIAQAAGARVLHTAGGEGVAAGRNLGAAAAAGDVLFFLDSDVMLAPDAIANAVAVLRSSPDIGAVCGVEDPEPLIRDSLLEEYRALQYHYWELSSQGDISFLCPAMLAIPAAVFAEVGPFNARLRHTEEVDYGQRLSAGHRVVLTADVHGAHDHDASLPVLLRKLFHRGRLRIPLYARSRRFARGYETASRALGCAAATLSVASLPVLALGPAWAAVPVLLALASAGCDAGMYRFVAARRGPAFCLYFLAVQFVVNVTIGVAVGAGAAQWLCSRAFREIYDSAGAPGSHPVAT